MMHVLANITIKPTENVLTSTIIPYFTNFTFLFMVISAFSVCCGYYERIKNGVITPQLFYGKRYKRVFPFFALMVGIDVLFHPDLNTIYEAFADLTLCFNLLPNPNIEVVGVGWFVGTVFTFYMLFPFFTFLLNSKRKGWWILLLSLIFCYIAIERFHPIGRVNIIYSAPFFISGGLIYLYKDIISGFVSRHHWLVLAGCIILTVLKFAFPWKNFFVLPDLILFSAWLMYAIGSRDFVLNNRVVLYLSKISMEIYLSHMMFYRAASMLHIENLISNENLLYITITLITLGGTICFSHIVKFWLFPKFKI